MELHTVVYNEYMRRLGIPALLLVLTVTVLLWVLAKGGTRGVSLARSLAQLSALLAATLAVLNFVLATRARFIERLFGPLDRVYAVHRLVGASAFIFMLYHPLLLVVDAMPNHALALRYLVPGGNLAYTLGIVALGLFIISIVLTLFVRMPYHWWKRTHVLMGIPLVALGFHVFTVPSDVSRFWPLTVWVALLFAAAAGAAVWRRFLYARFGPRHAYTVRQVRQLGAITEVYLVPHGSPLAFTPGQFVFVSFLSARISPEKHPFTISSAPNSPELRLSMKILGDWTAELGALAAGTDAVVYGPYGAFGERAFQGAGDQVWIAGGIGITPFLGMAAAYAATPGVRGTVHLFYCTGTPEEAAYLPELTALSASFPALHLTNHTSNLLGFITAERVAHTVGDVRRTPIFLCGPKPMTDALIAQFQELNVKPRNIITEDFSFLA
jgi:predicted ferric reductase